MPTAYYIFFYAMMEIICDSIVPNWAIEWLSIDHIGHRSGNYL